MDMAIHFPNLGIHLEHVGKTISVFGFKIAYYGIVITIGMAVGIYMSMREAKRTGQNPETYLDMLMITMFTSIAGARIYFVIFKWEDYKNNLLGILNTRQGGLAIYGGIIAGAITVYVFTRVKKMPFPVAADTVSMGLVTGQIIGRCGNFFNREVFGGYTDTIFAMQLPVSMVRQNEITETMWENIAVIEGVEYIQVHPTFLYESLWNLGVLLFLLWYRKRKKFRGELFLCYLIGYGAGRFWIEGIRTDQLLLPFIDIPVSQLLSALLVIISTILIVYNRRKLVKYKGDADKNDEIGRSETGN